ncbi:MAG: 23S rRNA (uracil(1939)-C(5))-methyltransferase RlmD [Bacteroidales bacterium]|nr:23S rRNA (uracil(1939)-C(5))-methyltransferase RlmD [Bacteroidales bacterium]
MRHAPTTHPTIFEQVEIIDAGSEGMSVGKVNDKVIFVPFVVPGDVVDVQIVRRKKKYLEGKAIKFHTLSTKRIDPHCSHFGVCGGCRWQNMQYSEQLYYKQKQVFDNLTRIGKLEQPVILPILPSPETRYYRNKLDFTFSNHRWLTEDDKNLESGMADTRALGFHVPQFFDKVVDIQECFHQKDPSNVIRNVMRKYAFENNLSFYDVRIWQGFLRNLIIRTTHAGGLMLIVVFQHEDEAISPLLTHLLNTFPEITSLYYVINPKKNDTINDLEFRLFAGEPYITEKMPPFKQNAAEIQFRIGPASFFQTNSLQSFNLYRTAAEFAGFSGNERVYDLYTGTGTIANYIAPYIGNVIGIESVESAIFDARINSQINGIKNTLFFAGETEKILTPEFTAQYGIPDVIITDPPRTGMHEKVIKTILTILPEKIVYVSCNPATQARDILLLSESYIMVKCQPIDMFPHTQHVENVALLTKKVSPFPTAQESS